MINRSALGQMMEMERKVRGETDSLVRGLSGYKASRGKRPEPCVTSTKDTSSTHQYKWGERKELIGNPDNPVLMNERS